ncbi:MAG: response regulator [Caulobacteraceae bacterium]|nr:response regulator [Caulobacter sp.]RYF95803.1 MAG: response regulator [Caulobacteraceae bacterium]
MQGHRSLLDSDKANLERVNFMIVDDNLMSLDIIASSISSFGVRNIIKCGSAREARTVLQKTTIDYLITDAEMPEEDGYSLIRWIRREGSEANRQVPIVLVTGHTRQSKVLLGRDCGAHFTVAKPLTPKVLLERIFWVARSSRGFVDCEAYCGPDRRFKRLGPPFGTDGRRAEDANGALGGPVEANLSQDEIDSFMKPAKVAL